MMVLLHAEVTDKLEKQINFELYSAYLYLAIANYYEGANLKGFHNWFQVQAKEELDHAMLILTYLQNNGEVPKLHSIAAPDRQYSDFQAPLEDALKHEQSVTAAIHAIYEAASKQKDFRTVQFLDWFVKEQGEEEKNTDDLVKRFLLFGNDAKTLYLMDSELAARVYAPPDLVL